jgi:hypothetical protein
MARRQLLRVRPEMLLDLAKYRGIASAGHCAPRDAKVVNRMIDVRGDILLLVESESAFP